MAGGCHGPVKQNESSLQIIILFSIINDFVFLFNFFSSRKEKEGKKFMFHIAHFKVYLQ